LFCIENSVSCAKEAYDAGREPVSRLLPMLTTCSDVFRAEYELGSPPVSLLWSKRSYRRREVGVRVRNVGRWGGRSGENEKKEEK
jgi:hypothetical protein